MRKLTSVFVVAALLACILVPSISFTEDRDTVLLARTLYALGRDESYETKLALGTVVMNRMENAWFGDTLGEVLEEQHQFPAGSRYDDESLRARGMNIPMCGACRSNMAIAPDGSVIPCQSWLTADAALGNILDDSFKNIWNSESCKKLRAMSEEEAKCCPFRKRGENG